MEPLNEAEKQFFQFALGTYRGLFRAVLTDSDIFLLATMGILLGGRSRRTRGLGIALGGWVLARRVDQYVGVIDSKVGHLVRVINESNQPPSDANG